MFATGGEKLYKITRCRDCPNAVIKIDRVEDVLYKLFQDKDFNERHLKYLKCLRPKHHDIFQVAIAGCPNSCSQPQIKDFGIQGQLVPIIGAGCTGCGLCVAACPDNCLELATSGPAINRELCINCGKCASTCPTGTIGAGEIGFRVIRGGKLGRRPVLAQEVCSLTDEKGMVGLLTETIDLLHQEGQAGERLGSLLERINCKDKKN
ncbi:4Fe-4S binding protein [Desulforamulus aquiferis]|uniref:Ferredoxin n=1 Tax=Desulforamulus aquiferis TaxID=1397668 RepID=A0AAW7ZDZ3_9FIRM|nr:4Fe-4S binding protein [Desulforamulus aquiferis]MDO7787984.1 4Fe-4S binding protein [Desulforamulus aquiferis]